ncbi:MAG: flagellar hook-basal body complex protein, partial [Eubacteriales bacterium]|nr:flagellar hook-basal body complex protein [Eubacteriales bacterium]
MNNAIYAATTGMINQARTLDVAASNIANAETAGYKRDQLITSSFSERLVNRLEGQATEIGAHTHGAIVGELVTDYTQGRLESTARALDFAILGEGYFSVEGPDGENAVTRDGHFEVDAEGFLR